MGAAVQAASILLSEPATQVASRWRTDRGITLEPVAPDTETMTHLRAIRRLAIEAIQA
jgi:hypothetical protein